VYKTLVRSLAGERVSQRANERAVRASQGPWTRVPSSLYAFFSSPELSRALCATRCSSFLLLRRHQVVVVVVVVRHVGLSSTMDGKNDDESGRPTPVVASPGDFSACFGRVSSRRSRLEVHPMLSATILAVIKRTPYLIISLIG